ncbi:MAG: MarR family transcriptional regulator [Chloroflexota bacterium]
MGNNLQETTNRFIKLAGRLRRLGPGTSLPEDEATSPSHLAMIEYAATTPGCGIQEMAEALNLSTPTVSISVRQMEKNNLISRKPHPKDGRAVQLYLTQKGKETHQRAHAFHHKKFEKLLSGLKPEERETLVSLLELAINAAEDKPQGEKNV